MQPDEHTFFVPELYAAGPSNQRTTNTDRFVSTWKSLRRCKYDTQPISFAIDAPIETPR